MKRCTKCGVEKPLEDFHRDRSRKDNRHPWCKKCLRAQRNAWYRKNRETNLDYQREWREKNKTHKAEYDAAWRTANLERKKAMDAAWREANREKFNESVRNWHRAHKDDPEYRRKRTERKRLRRAKRHGVRTAPIRFDEILQRDLGICGICAKQILDAKIHLDHIVPLAAGGTHKPENIQLAHAACNQKKHAKVNFTLADAA